MIYHAGQNQRIADIEHRNLCCPFQRVRFLVGRRECHQAGNVEGRCEHECQRFSRWDDRRHCSAEQSGIRLRGFCKERSFHERIVPRKDRIQCAEDGLLCKCTADECHERLPAHAEEASDRFDERSYTVEQAVVNIAVPAE